MQNTSNSVVNFSEWKTPDELKKDLQQHVKDVAENGIAWVLIHSDFAVAFGYADINSVITELDPAEVLNPKYIQEIRLFGNVGEWHIWKIPGGFNARLLVDTAIPASKYIEEYQALWGTKSCASSLPGWTTIYEDRGASLTIPHADVQVDQKHKRVRLCVRNYLAINSETHLTTIVDSRMVALCSHTNEYLPFIPPKKEIQ